MDDLPRILRYTTRNAPSANGKKPGPGERYACVFWELGDGQRLVLELGEEDVKALKVEMVGCDKPCCNEVVQAALPGLGT